jgi:hypothetical protein
VEEDSTQSAAAARNNRFPALLADVWLHPTCWGGEGKWTCWEAREARGRRDIVYYPQRLNLKWLCCGKGPRRRRKGWSDAIFNIEKAKRLEEMDDDRCDTEEEKFALREFKIDVIRKRRKLRSVNSRSISSVFIAGLPP